MNDEIDLWRRIVENDTTAFEVLFDRYARFVHRYLAERGASHHEAEELMAEVFLELWSRRRKLVLHEDGVRPLLSMIASGRIRNHLRSRRRKKNIQRLVLPVDEADPANDVAAKVDSKRQVEALRDKLSCLQQVEREAVEARMSTDSTYAETAAALGIPTSTLKTRLRRAFQKLRKVAPELDSKEEA